MTDTEGPRTEAGKRLLADDGFTVFDRVTLSDILAIEAEARADVDRRVDEANAFGYREGHRKARADVDGLSPLEALNERLVARIDELEARADVDGLVAMVARLRSYIESGESLNDEDRADIAALLAGDKAEAPE